MSTHNKHVQWMRSFEIKNKRMRAVGLEVEAITIDKKYLSSQKQP